MAACDSKGALTKTLAYSSEIWIKYGEGVTEAEAVLQQFVHQNANPDIFYTPAVYDYFTAPGRCNLTVTYILMERVNGSDPAQYLKAHPDETEPVFDRIVAAVRHLWSLPLPPGAAIGPLKGQKACDWFFSDYGADRAFETVDELEAWTNHKLEDTRRKERVDLKSLSSTICICHNDLSQFNILYGDRLVLLDWGMSGIYPQVFDEFALVRQFVARGSKFVKQLHKRLFGEKPSPTVRPLMLVSNINAVGWWG